MIKKQKTQSKLIIALTAVIILLVALSSTLTFAYFTAKNSGSSADMTFGTMSFSDETLDLTANDTHSASLAADVDNLVPGCEVKMTGGISMETTIAAFVRFQLQVTASAPYGHDATLDPNDLPVASTANSFVAVSDVNDQTKFAQVVFNKVWDLIQTGGANKVTGANWLSYYAEDNGTPLAGAGYLYLDRAVDPDTMKNSEGKVDLIKLDNLVIEFAANEFGNAWQGATVSIAIKADAIQAEHLGITGGTSTNPFTTSNISTLAALAVWNFNNGVDTTSNP